VIKIEKEKGTNWYVFLVIGILIGAVLGYYASEKGLLIQDVVGKRAMTNLHYSCFVSDPMGGQTFEGTCTSGGEGGTCSYQMRLCTNIGGGVRFSR